MGSDLFADFLNRSTHERSHRPSALASANLVQEVGQDLGDGTAALNYNGNPIAGGFVALVETGDGWRVTVPIELVQSNEYWPQTRHEWAVIASLMLAMENSLDMFEDELDTGKFKTLDQASERVGRLLGESVIVQSVIYASMKGKDAGDGAVRK